MSVPECTFSCDAFISELATLVIAGYVITLAIGLALMASGVGAGHGLAVILAGKGCVLVCEYRKVTILTGAPYSFHTSSRPRPPLQSLGECVLRRFPHRTYKWGLERLAVPL